MEIIKTAGANDWANARGDQWRAHLDGMEAMLDPVQTPLLQALDLTQPFRIAEIGCGGGGTSLEILRRAPAGSIVHGFDLSPALIETARLRQPPDLPALAFAVADMATAPPPGGPYHRLVSRFGIMFFDDPAAAFANLLPWLAPGGRFAFAVWGPPAENPWIATVREVVAGIIPLPWSDPAAPGPFRYADALQLQTVLENAGFAEIKISHWHGPLPIGGGLPAAAAADFALASFASFGELLTAAGDTAWLQAREGLTRAFLRTGQQDAIHLDASVHILTGGRPA